MLVLTRKSGQRLMIGDDIVVTVLSVRNGQVRLGLEAPRSTPIQREELRAAPIGADHNRDMVGAASR